MTRESIEKVRNALRAHNSPTGCMYCPYKPKLIECEGHECLDALFKDALEVAEEMLKYSEVESPRVVKTLEEAIEGATKAFTDFCDATDRMFAEARDGVQKE